MSWRSMRGSRPRVRNAASSRSANAMSLREYEIKTFGLDWFSGPCSAGSDAITTDPSIQGYLTASEDGSARIWSSQTFESIAVLKGHESEIVDAAFSRDGKRVLTAS